jgi:Trypsin-like peptidase domain
MNSTHFFYKLFLLDSARLPIQFLGTAFPVTPNGGLLTCRHVVDIQLQPGQRIAVYDNELNTLSPLPSAPLMPQNAQIDVAFLPNALSRTKAEFFPILSPHELKIGEDVYTFGYFAIGGDSKAVEQGYFSGKVVNFFRHETSNQEASFTLPYPILEGMSGSPVLTYHNGPKVVGMGIGNRSSRILASEIIEYKDGKTDFQETVNRIVEFGVGYHCAAIVSFLAHAGVQGFVVSNSAVSIPGL